MGRRRLAVLYDDGPQFQRLLQLVIAAQASGHPPAAIRISVGETRAIALNACHESYGPSEVRISVAGVPVLGDESLTDGAMIFDYE